MNYRKKLFKFRHPYKELGKGKIFLNAVKQNVLYHYRKCEAYKDLLENQDFQIDQLKNKDDLYKLPPIPTLYLKNHELFSKPFKKCLIKSETSGTSGKPSRIGLDKSSCWFGFKMVMSVLKKHKMFSAHFHNYLILGYKPSKRNKMGAVKTAYFSTFLTPSFHKEFAIIDTGQTFVTNFEGILASLCKYAKKSTPVRILGFPAYLYFLIEEMKKVHLKVKLPKKSMIILGGGWKQFYQEKVDKNTLYALAEEYLGIKPDYCREFFGVVEHNVPYLDCKYHHFHVPVYSEVLIRDPQTLKPLPFETPGLLNLITPLVKSMPLTSILTDDVAILHEGEKCPCGNNRPYFEILGRAGHQDIKTCANQAIEMIGEKKHESH